MLMTAYLTVVSYLSAAALVPAPAPDGPDHPKAPGDTIPWRQPAEPAADDAAFPLINEPFFPGGPPALAAYLKNPDWYPAKAVEAGLEGTVHMRFRVLATGRLSDIEVVKSRGPILDKAACTLIERMPRWFPAHRGGMAVSRLYELQITFRLTHPAIYP